MKRFVSRRWTPSRIDRSDIKPCNRGSCAEDAGRRDAWVIADHPRPAQSVSATIEVLRGIDLRHPGRAVRGRSIGRSGCGKSTLLRILVAGLDAPSAGHLSLSRLRMDSRNGTQDVRVIVFQEPRLLPWAFESLSNVEPSGWDAGVPRRISCRSATASVLV
jgi:ABC-type taurine transport system ATPase subunit